jgi:hypothetical protein
MAKKPMLPLSPALSATGGVIDLGPGSTGPKWNHKKMNWDPISPLPTKEIQKRLTNLENGGNQVNRPTVTKIGDQYQLEANTVYTAYASALLNLSSAGKIINQSDASTFQLTPYDALGVLLPFRGYFENNSIYQSGDPTDYTWESTLEDEGFGFSERYFTDSAELVDRLGNPTKPLNSTVWTPLAASVAVPASAAFFAQRFNTSNTSGSVSSPWKIEPVGKYIGASAIADNSIGADAIADDSIGADAIIDNSIGEVALNTSFYEEGTWDPTLDTVSNPSFFQVNYQTRQGNYTKIGNVVTLTFEMSTSSITLGAAGGALKITGLPFGFSTKQRMSFFLVGTNYNWASSWTPPPGAPVGPAPNKFGIIDLSSALPALHLYFSEASGADSLGFSVGVESVNTGSYANNISGTVTYLTDD